MGSLFKPRLSRPLPPGAVVTDGVARWKTRAGKARSAESRDGRIFETGTKWIARYRDGEGVTRTVATGCREESSARTVLVELERRAELVRAGVLTPAQDAVSSHTRTTITTHVDAYIRSLEARGCTAKHVKTQRRLVMTVLEECRFRALQDIKREPMERWLATGANRTRSAHTRNTYTIAVRAFLNHCVDTDRLLANPLARIPLADERSDRRRQPRAFTADEVTRLLDAARRRPLDEARRFNRGWRAGQVGTQLRPETVARLERLGLERALTWKILVLTGLRLGELAALRVCDAQLDGPRPHLALEARHEKARRGAELPLRADLATDLRAWVAGRAPDEPLVRLGDSALKIFNRDLTFAGITKRDDRGRTACIHSLRGTHGTLLTCGGVGPRVVQASLRHATLNLSMTAYTDDRLLNVERALDALPAFPLAAAAS